MRKRYYYIFFNIFIFITFIWNWNELYSINGDLKTVLINISVIIIILNVFIFMLVILYNKFFNWYDKRSKEKYNFYDWMGNPDSPINMYEAFKNKKNFSPKEFNKNCKLIKKKIKEEMVSIDKLNSYKTFLELQISSPRLNAVMNSSQTILIAVITAALVTFLNFFNVKSFSLIISYFVAIVFIIGLFKAIDFFSSEIDRNKLLLVLVKECIEENESEE